MNPLRIDHTAVVVRDLDRALERYERLFDVRDVMRARVPDQDVEVAFLSFDDTQVELICPLSGASGVGRFLERHGESLHHIGIAVDDIRSELTRLEALGVELIDRAPRPGVHGLIAFLHPRATGGVLVELVERE
jgi:methylmalonyl-CoA/ethylmalonyl-CoA epimerase